MVALGCGSSLCVHTMAELRAEPCLSNSLSVWPMEPSLWCLQANWKLQFAIRMHFVRLSALRVFLTMRNSCAASNFDFHADDHRRPQADLAVRTGRPG